MTRRVYVPNKTSSILDEAKKQLYLLKTAITVENEKKLLDRIDKIRALIKDVEESLAE